MAKLFGVVANSLYYLYLNMRNRYGRRRVIVLTNDLAQVRDRRYRRRVRRAKILLASSVRDLLANLTIINKCTAPLVVFGNPLVLQNYPITLLDGSAQNASLIGKFNYTGLDYASLIDAIERPSRRRHRLTRLTTDLLPKIIEEYTISGFIDKFNSLLYAITNAHNRLEIRSIMVRLVFDRITIEEFNQQLQHSGVILSSKSRPLHQAMLDYLASDKGVVLRKALTESIRMETELGKTGTNLRRTIKYKELSERFGLDRFDLRNLILMYRATR
jgi:hypothetical protein